MRNVFAILVLIGVMMIVSRASAAPSFSGAPGYISLPVVTIDGDPSPPNYTAGIQGFDGDENETAYIFGEDRYILKKELGAPATELYDYGSTVWGSFVKLQGEVLYCGESKTGTVIAIPAAGGTAHTLFTLENNYDCAFNSQSLLFISANPGRSGNRIYAWWEGQTEAQEIADVGNNSGPIAFDESDNLFYGRYTSYSPGLEDIVYFSSVQVAAAISTGTPLTSADWTVYVAGVNAPGGLAFDGNTPFQDLFSTSSGLGTLSRYSPGVENLIGTGTYPATPRFFGSSGFGAFINNGGTMVVNCTDYDDSYDSTVYMVESCSQNFILGSGDYGTVGQSDIAIFRPSTGLWAIRGVSRIYFGTEGDLPVSGNYDGNGQAEPAIFRPNSGLWVVAGGDRAYYGGEGDIPLPRDYDDDGTADRAIFRPSAGLWSIQGISRTYFGSAGDFPVPENYEGAGINMGIFRPSTGLWALNGLSRVYYGMAGDLPVPGDYNGDGTAEVGIYRPSTGLWAIQGVTRIYFGSAEEGDWPLPLDAAGDGTTEIGIYRPDAGLWAIRDVTRVYYGSMGDFPASR